MSAAPRYIPNYTVNDYMLWEGDWQLIDGVPIAMSPSPFGQHERIVMEHADFRNSAAEKSVSLDANQTLQLQVHENCQLMLQCGRVFQ